MRLLPQRLIRVVTLSLLPIVAAAQTAPAPAPPAAAPAPAQAASAAFSKEQLEQLLAPIALYPDSLLSQVLMASTYPVDVAEAAKCVKAVARISDEHGLRGVQHQCLATTGDRRIPHDVQG